MSKGQAVVRFCNFLVLLRIIMTLVTVLEFQSLPLGQFLHLVRFLNLKILVHGCIIIIHPHLIYQVGFLFDHLLEGVWNMRFKWWIFYCVLMKLIIDDSDIRMISEQLAEELVHMFISELSLKVNCKLLLQWGDHVYFLLVEHSLLFWTPHFIHLAAILLRDYS